MIYSSEGHLYITSDCVVGLTTFTSTKHQSVGRDCKGNLGIYRTKDSPYAIQLQGQCTFLKFYHK